MKLKIYYFRESGVHCNLSAGSAGTAANLGSPVASAPGSVIHHSRLRAEGTRYWDKDYIPSARYTMRFPITSGLKPPGYQD